VLDTDSSLSIAEQQSKNLNVNKKLSLSIHKTSVICIAWQLQISSQKCCVIDVGKSTAADAGYPRRLRNEGLTTSENVRDLGVVVDSHLCFSEHIADITLKAHQRANLIHRCFSSRNRDMLVKAFKDYVHPILEFYNPV